MSTNIRPISRVCPADLSSSTRYNPHVFGGGSVVPYVASWTSEATQQVTVVSRLGGGIAYGDETSVDRDEWDVLWVRMDSKIGVGRPLFKALHLLRQRRAMLRLLCQVCGQPAGRTKDGNLWLVPALGGLSATRCEGVPVTLPPVCVACARLSVQVCPALRSEYVAFRAHSRVCGVTGIRFRPGRSFPGLVDQDDEPDLVFDYEDPAVRWVMATQRVRSLHGCVEVDLTQL